MDKAIKRVWFEDNKILIVTLDGEVLSQPLEVYPSLLEATDEQRYDYEIWDEGQSIRWEIIDEDVHISEFYEKETVNYDNEVNRLLSRFPYLNLKAFAEYIGMHWTKLARYRYGVWTPGESDLDDIKSGLQRIGREMLEAV